MLDEFAATSLLFSLDGSPLEADRTPVKEVVTNALGWFGFTTGALLPPGSLSLGGHTVVTTIVYKGVPVAAFTRSFTVVSCS